MPSRGGKPSIACQERGVERFREGYVHGVAGGQVFAQLPNARQKEVMWISVQRKLSQIGESCLPAPGFHFSHPHIAANNLRHFYIRQMGCVQGLSRAEQSPFYRFRNGRAEKYFEQSRRVYDDHEVSRSSRTARAGATDGVTAERRSKRARSSSNVGRSAS